MAREDTKTGRHAGTEAADESDEKPPGRLGRWFARQRESRPWLDHIMVAANRYTDRNGDHMAAAITYFSFLALFPLLLLAVGVAGFVLASRPDLVEDLGAVVAENIPGGLGDTIREGLDTAIESRGVIGGFGLIVLLYSGLGWIANLRTAMRAMWGDAPRKTSFVRDKLGDLLALACLGVALLASVGISAVVGALTDVVLDLTGLADVPGAGFVTQVLGIVIAVLADMVIFLWLLVNLARRPITYRAVLTGALLGAIGFEILKLVGTLFIATVSRSPAASVFGSVIGLLVWFNLIARFTLFTAAWTATSRSVLAAEERARIEAEGGADEPTESVAPVEPVGARVGVMAGPGPSPGMVFGSVLGLGAVVGMLLPPVVRRWWYAGKPPPRA